MRNSSYRALLEWTLLVGLVAGPGATRLLAQTAATPAEAPTAAKPAVPKPAVRTAPARPPSQVTSVIQLVKSGMSESLIIKELQGQNKPANLSTGDLVRLQNGGVSENIINAMIDPTAGQSATVQATVQADPPSTVPTPSHVVSDATLKALKKRVIVDDFDYSTVMTSVQAVFGTNQDIGRGIRAMLTNKMSNQGRVIIVERAKIDALMKEQDRNQSNRVKQGTGALSGRITGADALLTGDITTFGRDDKKKSGAMAGLTSLAALGGPLMSGAAAVVGAATSQEKAVVVITFRMVDAENSEVIATGQARGESIRKTKAINALAAGWNKGGVVAGGGSFDMSSSNFAETIIGEATQDCVNKLADILNTQAEAMKRTVRAVEASVADISGNTMTISAGINDGVNEGDLFEIFRVTHEVRDPVTKEVLDRMMDKVGELIVISVRDRIATGTYQGAKPKVAYVARRKV